MRLPGNGRPTSADLDLVESHRLHRRNRQQLEREGGRGGAEGGGGVRRVDTDLFSTDRINVTIHQNHVLLKMMILRGSRSHAGVYFLIYAKCVGSRLCREWSKRFTHNATWSQRTERLLMLRQQF